MPSPPAANATNRIRPSGMLISPNIRRKVTKLPMPRASTTVVMPLPQRENRFLRIQPNRPVSTTGGASCGRSPTGMASVMSALPQRDALVIPVHEGRYRQADREISRHDDQDVLD